MEPQGTSAPAATAERARWFAEEVYAHDAALKSHLRGWVPSLHDVDDVVQESYIRVWKRHAIRPIESAKAFLFTVAQRLALDVLRRERRSPVLAVKELDTLFVPDPSPNACDSATHTDEVRLLVEAVEKLPVRCREIFVLCHLQRMRQHEVARRLGISENTVGVQAARGLQRCEAYVRSRLISR